jgi:tetratricopeptide (TPR) repeat protein
VRALSTANPNLLEGVNNLALALIRLDRGEEALALLDAAIERTRAGTASERFGDQSEHLNWTRNNRAYALLSLGRREDAVAEMRRGARLPESGRVNVSQTFNLANLLLRLGRSQEALETLAEVDLNYSSPYGWMVAHHAIACAQVELGRRAEAEALLVQMRARGSASRTILRETELCFGHIEEAAALYLRDLEDPDERGPALLSAQTFRLPRHQLPFDARMSERWRSVLARADVRAALDRHGRVLALPILETQY